MVRIPKSGFPGPGPALSPPTSLFVADRLALTAFMAVVIHVLVILGVSLAPPERERREQRSLDVLLVHRSSLIPPEEAHYVAEAHQRGAGDRPEAPPATPAGAAQATLDPAPLPAAARANPSPESGSAPVPSPVVRSQPNPDPKASAETSSAATVRARAMEDLSAEIDQRLKAFEARPKRKWTNANTREHAYAAYMEAWRKKVERIGNLHYPQEARRLGLSGRLSLDVALHADGTVAEIFVRRSSGESVLDEAAVRIVGLAAPFSEFPPAIRREVDVLHIERTWQFSSGDGFNSP